ncbi:MAG TPA: hypothetical protein VF049_22260 [Nocardioidaceae bacterium]
MPSRFEYERAIRASELKPPSRHLGLTIATWADVRTGIIPDRLQPSLTVLERTTGLSRATVRTHLTLLEKGGWLDRDRPSVAKARADKETTKYRLLVPKTVVLPVEDDSEARAGAALVEEPLGQELPQPRAGAALELGQELTPSRAGAALSSYRSTNGPEVPPTIPLPDQMLTEWWTRYGHTTAQNKNTIRRAITDALTNGLAPATLWSALDRLGNLSKPITGGTLQFALSELRPATTGADVVPLRPGTTTEDPLARAMARARARMQQKETS